MGKLQHPFFAIARSRITPSSSLPFRRSRLRAQSVRLVCRIVTKVRAIVHRDVRLVVDRRQYVLVIGCRIFALDGINRNALIAHQAGETSSCVESGFDAHNTTSAPPSRKQIARFAVSAVTCRHAEMRNPLQRAGS